MTLLRSDLFASDEVDLYLFGARYEQAEPLPENINCIYLKPMPFLCRAIPFDVAGLFVRRYAKKLNGAAYDIAIDYDGYSPDCAAAALAVKARKKIIWVHSDYLQRRRYDKKFRFTFFNARSKFKHFDVLVSVSVGALEALRTLLPKKLPEDCIVVPNLIDTTSILQKAGAYEFEVDKSKINICGVGHLEKIKGFDLLIKDFAFAWKRNPSIECYIIGDGAERKSLEELAERLGVRAHVHFLGRKENPYPVMAVMDALCHEALYEGQGIVVRESQVLGLSILIPRRLERYNPGVIGSDDLVERMAGLSKTAINTERDSMEEYNTLVKSSLRRVMKAKP